MWCFKVPNRLPLSLTLKDHAQLLHIPVIPLAMATNTPYEFTVVFSLKPGHKDLL